MSYNKLKSLVANVEAIETAMKIQVQGRQATAEEKEILSRYSGFGGIKEVLNIGTDKPIGGDMKEPIQRLQELINAYPHFTEPMRHNVIEGIKASVLTAFYTPKFLVDAVVRQIHATFSENGLKMRSFLEPSAGIGGFLPIAIPMLILLIILSFINLKIYDEKKYQKLEHDFRLMSVPQRKKHKNIFFLFLLTTILVILVDIMLLYSYNSHMNNLT